MDVEFSSIAGARAFARGLANGFGMRLVDGEAPNAKAPSPSPGDERLPKKGGGFLWLRPVSILTGDMIAAAWPETGEGQGGNEVDFRLTEDGQVRFAAVTGANVGRAFAIVVDGVVVTAPVIRDAITGGQGEISGDFTPEAAAALARSLLAHKDDLPLRVVD
jgi:preprotein translocase subunit SecD